MTEYVIITGANGGIGLSLVKKFTEAGFGVIATDIGEQNKNLKCDLYIKADLQQTVIKNVFSQELFRKIRAEIDKKSLKAVINNAAVQILGGVEDLDYDAWKRTFDVNLLAPFFWTQAFLTELEAANGSILNISSIHARLTKKNFVAYATSKAALSGLTRAMAVDLGDRVRVNAIEPAAIETDMLKAGFASKPELYRQLKECHPQLRIGDVSEVANLALSIVNGDIKFLHGATIPLDGGISGRLFDPD